MTTHTYQCTISLHVQNKGCSNTRKADNAIRNTCEVDNYMHNVHVRETLVRKTHQNEPYTKEAKGLLMSKDHSLNTLQSHKSLSVQLWNTQLNLEAIKVLC